jgi:predicted GNAT family acetyltransferase
MPDETDTSAATGRSTGTPEAVEAADAGDEFDARERTVVEDVNLGRFEILVDGRLAAFTQYRIEEPGRYAFIHTRTLPEFAGHGIATALVHEVLERMRAGGFSVLPYCPFVNDYLRRHPQDADLVPASEQRRFGVAA